MSFCNLVLINLYANFHFSNASKKIIIINKKIKLVQNFFSPNIPTSEKNELNKK